MRLFQNSTRKHHLTSQRVDEVLERANTNTFPHARHERWTATPLIEDFAELHPERTVRVSFCHDTIIEEFIRLEDALVIGGYRYNGDCLTELIGELANQALVTDLVQIAMRLKIVNYEFEYEETQDEDTSDLTLIATFIFKDTKDAERFDRVVKLMGYCGAKGTPLGD
jgi:hypothetical protein